MWTPENSEELYNLPRWGQGYVSINDVGHVEIAPNGADTESPRLDLAELVAQIRRRGMPTPLLMRFDGILRARVRELNGAFHRAREEFGYTAPYRGVYPIKVNQERWVVETLLEEGRAHGMGLEVGSKPELIAGIALHAGRDGLIICNGYKDNEYVEMALLASRLGAKVILVVEKRSELELILECSRRVGVKPAIGVRAKLSLQGSGRWMDSAGDKSKFGLSYGDIVDVVRRLEAEEQLDCLELLHFHIGSQISHVRSLKKAMREATHILRGLHEMGARVHFFDAGGGLGVDYDGSQSATDSSMNYRLQEYANDVVWHLVEACREHGMPEPILVTESGRALVAHHSVLITEVIGTTGPTLGAPFTDVDESDHELVRELAELCEGNQVGLLERYHDAHDARERATALFSTGQMSLPERARVDELFWRFSRQVYEAVRKLDHVPDDLAHLERSLADTYFVNASIFQSIPDAWAIEQLFPIVPIARHTEEPTRRAILGDLTCDSDGKISKFVGREGAKDVLEVHSLEPGQTYDLGFFLVGAYQEILGDMHNLFGDTNIVHVDMDESGKARLSHVLRGDRVKDVLGYVEYVEEDLLRGLRSKVEDALDEGHMTFEESARFWDRYESGLRGSTYLTPRAEEPAPHPPEEIPLADSNG